MENDEEESSESNLVIITNKYRFKFFFKLYWRTLLIIVIPLVWLPVAICGDNNAYKCFYVCLLTSSYWVTDVLHPAVVSLIPVALYTIIGAENPNFLSEIFIRNDLINNLGTLMMITAIEESKVNRRVALILLMRIGCSHYRLSFLLFISTMFISMWVSNGLACGLMMPIVKAVLIELERMGILEMYQVVDKTRQQSSRHEQKSPKPTDFTVFYFLGIAYSSTLGIETIYLYKIYKRINGNITNFSGGIATLSGSNSNDVLKYYFESYFPGGPKLEFPHFMLLNLPGVLLMESLLYLWLNFFFMGMFRSQSDIALQIGISEEEAQYIQTLLANQYMQLGRISFHEAMVAIVVFLDITFDAVSFATRGHSNVSSPTIVFVVLLFILPRNMEFMKFFRRRSDTSVSPLPIKQTNGCLNWDLVRDNMLWEVIFIIGSSCIIFDNMMMSQMANEFETFLLYFKEWPLMLLSLIVIVLCKTLTEFGSNSSVAYLILPCIARFSILAKVNPIYMMTAATISGSLPFNLITGTSAHAFVIAYVNMPHYKMVQAGIGPTLFSIVIIWITVTLWATTIWPDIMLYPAWATKDLVFVNITS